MVHTFSPVRLCRRSLLAAALAVSTAAAAAPGDLDLQFGADGVVLVSLGGGNERFSALLPEADGSVLAAGGLYSRGVAQTPPSGYDLSVVRVLPNGQLDPDFGLDGLSQVDTGDDGDEAFALARQPDGKLVVAGGLDSGAYSDFGVARLHPDGSLDTGFGEPDGELRRGYARVNIGPTNFVNDQARAVALQSDGRIVLAGVGYAFADGFNYQRFALVRFSADGELDTGFGEQGRVVTPASAFQVSEYVTGIATRRDGSLPDDRITVVGYVFARSTALIRRYLPDGQLDPAFGVGGELILKESVVDGVRRGIARIDAAVWTDEGKLLVVGSGAERGFVFLRFHADGSLDHSFGSDGRALVKFSEPVYYDEPAALSLQGDGKILAAGYASMAYESGTRSADFAVVQLLADGTPDPRFGDGSGRSTFPVSIGTDAAHAVAVTGDGAVLAAGRANDDDFQGSGGAMRAAFMRLLGDGGLFRDGFE